MPGRYVPLPDAKRYIPGFQTIWNIDGSVKFTLPDGRWHQLPPSIDFNDVMIDFLTGDMQMRKALNVADIFPGSVPGMPPLGPAPAFPTYTAPHTTPIAPPPPVDPMIYVLQGEIKNLEATINGIAARMNAQEIEMDKLRTQLTEQASDMYDLKQENREVHERNDALEDQNEAVNEQLDDVRQELADVMKSNKKKKKPRETGTSPAPGGLVASGGWSVPADQEYSFTIVTDPNLNPDQIAARVTRDLTRKGIIKNPW